MIKIMHYHRQILLQVVSIARFLTSERTRSATLDSTGPLAVQVLICVAVMEEHSKVSRSNTVTPGMGTSVGASGRGKRLNRSALPFWALG